MPQAVQRVVHARRGEQRQRLGRAGRHLVRAVGDAVVHGGQIGQVEHLGQALALRRAELALEVLVLGQREGQGDRLVAGAHFQRHAVVVDQQAELLLVVVGVQIGARQRGFVLTGSLHESVRQARVGMPAVRHTQPHERVAGTHARQLGRRFGRAGKVGRQRRTQMGAAGVVDLLGLGQGGRRVGEGNGGCEGSMRDHGALSMACVTAVRHRGRRRHRRRPPPPLAWANACR